MIIVKELSGDIPFIIICSNIDLEDKRKTSTEQIKAKTEKFGAKFFETSAKLNESVDSAFEDLSILILNNLKNKHKSEALNIFLNFYFLILIY